MFNFLAENNIDLKDLTEKINSNNSLVLDVREDHEVEEGHLASAKWMALSELSADPESYVSVLKEKHADKEILVYCRSGNRSGQTASFLKAAGFNTVNIGAFEELAQYFDTKDGELEKIS